MARYRFIIDHKMVKELPKDWNEATFKILRSPKNRALILNYAIAVTFHGEAYNIIKAKIKAEGLCSSVRVQIERTQDTTFFHHPKIIFDGILRFVNGEEDLTRKTFKGDLVDTNLAFQIANALDTTVSLDQANTISGEVEIAHPLTPVAVSEHRADDGTYPTGSEVGMYKVSDVMQFLLDYVTDNRVTFQSEFFQTLEYKIEKWRIQFSGPLVAGNTINIQYTNFYGLSPAVPIVVPFNSSNAQTLLDLAEALTQQLNVGTVSFFQAYYYYDASMPANPVSNGVDAVTFDSWFPIKLLEVSVTGAGAPFPEVIPVQSYSYGMKDLYLAFGNDIRSAPEPVFRSVNLGELLKELYALFGVAYTVEKVGPNNFFILEPYSSFFQNTRTLKIKNVRDIQVDYTDDYTYSRIAVGSPVSNGNYDTSPLTFADNYALGGCYGVLDLKSEYIADIFYGSYLSVAPNSDFVEANSNKWFFIQKKPGINETEQSAFSVIDIHGNKQTVYAINPGLTNISKLVNNFGVYAGNPRRGVINRVQFGIGGFELTNPTTFKNRNLYKFTKRLCTADFLQILDNSYGYITFQGCDGIARSAFIQELERTEETGSAEWKLIGK